MFEFRAYDMTYDITTLTCILSLEKWPWESY